MKNENVSAGKRIGGILLDIITIGLLLAAFGMVFYAGFITEEEDLTLNIMSAVTAVGLILLFLIGTFSCLITKVKTNSLTAGFLAFAAVQLYALLSNLVVLGCLLINLYTVEDLFMQVSYVVTTAIILIGYVVNIISFSNNNIPVDDDDELEFEEDEGMEYETDFSDEEVEEDETDLDEEVEEDETDSDEDVEENETDSDEDVEENETDSDEEIEENKTDSAEDTSDEEDTEKTTED